MPGEIRKNWSLWELFCWQHPLSDWNKQRQDVKHSCCRYNVQYYYAVVVQYCIVEQHKAVPGTMRDKVGSLPGVHCMTGSDLIYAAAVFTHLVHWIQQRTIQKSCQNDCIIQDLLFIVLGCMEEVRRSSPHNFAERRAFCPAAMCCLLSLTLTHKRSPHFLPFQFLPHVPTRSAFRRPCACYVLSALGQRFIVLWSLCHFTLHWPARNYSIYPKLNGGGVLGSHFFFFQLL